MFKRQPADAHRVWLENCEKNAYGPSCVEAARPYLQLRMFISGRALSLPNISLISLIHTSFKCQFEHREHSRESGSYEGAPALHARLRTGQRRARLLRRRIHELLGLRHPQARPARRASPLGAQLRGRLRARVPLVRAHTHSRTGSCSRARRWRSVRRRPEHESERS